MPSTLVPQYVSVIPESVAAIFVPRTVQSSESAAFIPIIIMHAFISVRKTMLIAEKNLKSDYAVGQF